MIMFVLFVSINYFLRLIYSFRPVQLILDVTILNKHKSKWIKRLNALEIKTNGTHKGGELVF